MIVSADPGESKLRVRWTIDRLGNPHSIAERDPCMRDPNIRKAAGMQRVAWPALG